MSNRSGDRLTESVRRTGARAHRSSALRAWLGSSLFVIAGGALCSATRALIWPRDTLDAALVGAPRAAGLFVAGALVSGIALAVLAWIRSRPTALHAARAIDQHLGLDDVVASGHAFQRGGIGGPAAELSTERARAAIVEFHPSDAIAMPRIRPRPRRVLLGLLIATLGVGAGTLDSRVVAALVTPPTAGERRALSELEAAARALEEASTEQGREEERDAARERERSPAGRSNDASGRDEDRAVAAQARQAARASRRGDRTAAMRALRQIAVSRARQARRVRRRSSRLSSLASDLGAPPQAGRRGARSPSARANASERAREMSRLLRRRREEPTSAQARAREQAETRRTLDRLERAASRAHRGGRDELSEALQRAAQALAQGRSGNAAEALDRAASALERLEAQNAEERTSLARQASVAERAASAERALQLARMGRDGDGNGDGRSGLQAGRDGDQSGRPGGESFAASGGSGRTLSATLMNRLAALGLAQSPAVTSGGGGRSRRGPSRASLTPQSDSHARSIVSGVGGQAVAALEGLGTNGEPTTEYREVFPSYGVRVEEALADERIPAARRATVRRYFESIRPDVSP